MDYTIDKTVTGAFNNVIERTIAALKNEGFGVLTDVDVRATLKAKLGADFRSYRILGTCNPPLAKSALELGDKTGVLLPGNVVVQEKADNSVEVSAVNPLASMERPGNEKPTSAASKVARKLERVVAAI